MAAHRRTSAELARLLWTEWLGRYWRRAALALAAMGVYAASASAIPAGVEKIIAAFSGGTPDPTFGGKAALWGPALIVALGAVNAAAQYAQARLSASAALDALKDLQNAMFARLTFIDDAQLRGFGAGQSISRLTSDVATLRETLQRIAAAARDILTLIGLCAAMIWADWVLFLVVIVVYGALGWPVSRIGARIRKRSREVQDQTGETAGLVGEAVAAGRTIRSYQLEGAMGARADAAFERRRATLQKMANLRAANEPFIFFVGAIAIAIVVAVAALRIEAGALDAPKFIAFLLALVMLSQPARGLSTLNAVAQEGFGAFERMLDLLDAAPAIADRKGARALAIKRGAVVFDAVRFGYGGGVDALDGLSFEAPAGKTLALVGESGAGKSTVFTLLLRLYDPQAGRILIDGVDTRDATLESLRRQIAVVSQEATLFDDTVAANIGFGRAGASRANIEAAAGAAAADGFIRGLPNGYETRVGEGGGALSGGQRQRIAIARAFLKDAPILLLDEATSALDADSEAAIQGALARLSRGRTTIVIAHRLSTIRAADLIVAMDKGRVIESGRHDELLARGGYYARVTRLQAVSG